MTGDFGNTDRQDVQELNEDQLLNELDSPVECPDLTRSIMGKLGYMKAHPNVVRRTRILRHVKRGLLGVVALVALGVGIFIHNHGPDARRQIGPSLTEAVNHDISRQQQRIGNVLESFRNFPPASFTTEPKPLPNEMELMPNFNEDEDDHPQIARAPFRWM